MIDTFVRKVIISMFNVKYEMYLVIDERKI